jgi:hypothetical protein
VSHGSVGKKMSAGRVPRHRFPEAVLLRHIGVQRDAPSGSGALPGGGFLAAL